MNAKSFFKDCLSFASKIVKQVRPTEFDLATPCSEWDVRQLAGHMLYELSWIPEVLAGKTTKEVGSKYDGNLIIPNLKSAWLAAAKHATESVNRVDIESIAHLSFGDRSNEYYIWQVGGEMLIHGWDLATAIGQEVKFDDKVAHTLYERVKPNASGMHKSGLFSPVIEVPSNADTQIKLLALFGRSN